MTNSSLPERADQLDDVLRETLPLVRARYGADAALEAPLLLKDASRMLVVRMRLTGQRAAPSSVIAKTIRDDPATGFSEWASLAFLSATPEARTLVPGFVGGSAAARLFVMDDLGAGQTLDDILQHGAAPSAERTLVELARQMARLHAATLGRAAAFDAIRGALPAAEQVGRQREADAWLAARERFSAWLTAAGCALPADLDEATRRVADAYARPGPWLAFSHGDPAPSNCHIAGDTVRLIDFEYGAFRHALYDITAWEILCPLPRRQASLMRRAFQQELAARLPLAGDERAFAEAWGQLCAYRALALLSWVSPAVLDADRPMVGAWTAREAVLAAVTRLAHATSDLAQLAPIGVAAGTLGAALRARWPALGARPDISTLWPAFDG